MENRNITTKLTAILNMYKIMFKSVSSDAKPAGDQCWNHLVNNSRSGVDDGLPKWFMASYKGDQEAIQKKMTRELDIYFTNDYEFDFSNHWNHYVLDWTIEEKAQKVLKSDSFD